MMNNERRLHEFLSSVDEEYKVEIFSCCPIHDKEVLALITTVLFKYDLRGELELGNIRTMADRPKEFPELPMATVYSVKATLGTSPELGAMLQELAARIGHPANTLAAKLDNAKEIFRAKVGEYVPDMGRVAASKPAEASKLSWPMVDTDSKAAQETVGQSRVGTLLSILNKSSEEAKKVRDERTKAVMTHLGIKESLGVSLKKGYYIVTKQNEKHEFKGPYIMKPYGGILAENKLQLEELLG